MNLKVRSNINSILFVPFREAVGTPAEQSQTILSYLSTICEILYRIALSQYALCVGQCYT